MADDTGEITVVTPITADDYRALYRWLVVQPGPSRRSALASIGFYFLLGGVNAQASPVRGAVILAALLALLLRSYWRSGTVLERARGTAAPVRVRIDGHGIRCDGATDTEVAWVRLERAEVRGGRLLGHVGIVGHVYPLPGIGVEDLDRIRRWIALPLPGTRTATPGAPALDDPPVATTEALVVRWESTPSGSQALQRFSHRVTPGTRRSFHVASLGFGLAVGVGAVSGGLDPEGGLVLAVVAAGVMLLVFPRWYGWGISRRLPHGDCEAVLDADGVGRSSPTTTWRADWSVVQHWGIERDHLCLLAKGFSGIAIPVAVLPDRPGLEAWLTARLGPPA